MRNIDPKLDAALDEVLLKLVPPSMFGVINPDGIREDKDVHLISRNKAKARLAGIVAERENYILELADHTHGCGLKMVPTRSVDGSVTMYCQRCDVSEPSARPQKGTES